MMSTGSMPLPVDLLMRSPLPSRILAWTKTSVNGTSLGILWNAPFRADVTRLLKAGPNRLEVRVTNLWHNRIVGDLRSPEAGTHARTNLKHKFSADMELLPSGLLGPVVLRSFVEVDMPI